MGVFLVLMISIIQMNKVMSVMVVVILVIIFKMNLMMTRIVKRILMIFQKDISGAHVADALI